jgi:hypothetical protein
MDYEGVNADTIDNGRALNSAFIQFILATAGGESLDDRLRERLVALEPAERARLASVPFLLYTLEPLEPGVWRPGTATEDLFAPGTGGPEWRLVTATLALLWSLARANRYAARFLYGVPVARCDAIAALPLMGVIDAARRSATGVVQRMPRNEAFWRKLFVSATDPRPRVRRAARQSALQCVLTVAQSPEPLPLATAACRRRSATRVITAVSEPDRNRRS